MVAFDVYFNGKLIDTVFFRTSDRSYARAQLIREGYNSNIWVTINDDMTWGRWDEQSNGPFNVDVEHDYDVSYCSDVDSQTQRDGATNN